MKVLINLATLKKGGGQNVGLNFLESLQRLELDGMKIVFAVARDTEISKFIIRKESTVIFFSKNPILRMLKELMLGWYLIKKYQIDIVYSYFGIGLYPKSIPQISGSADSNLYFPEIDFWKNESTLKKIINYFKDKYRIWGLKKATAVVFENESMEKKGKELFGLNKTTFIKPSINTDFPYQELNLDSDEISNNKKVGLFLCGYQKNKNYTLIPELAFELNKRGYPFHFLFTAPKNGAIEQKKFESTAAVLGVHNHISIIGQVKKEELKSLYNKVDFVFLLSNLESFSNNIIESWYFEKPLIISDETWSRSICNDAGVFVDRSDINDISDKVIKLISNQDLYKSEIEKGKIMLSVYPSIDERTEQELSYINEIFKSH